MKSWLLVSIVYGLSLRVDAADVLGVATNDQELCRGGVAMRTLGSNEYLIAVGAVSREVAPGKVAMPEAQMARVAHAKALAQMALYLKTDVSVSRKLCLDERHGKGEEESTSIAVARSRVQLNRAKPAGRWCSSDKTTMYEAIYIEINKKEELDEKVKM